MKIQKASEVLYEIVESQSVVMKSPAGTLVAAVVVLGGPGCTVGIGGGMRWVGGSVWLF